MSSPTAQAALEYLARGWSVFPVNVYYENGRWRKKPLVDWKGLQAERPTEEEVAKWWEQFPDAAIGVALGQVSNLMRVDFEGPVPWDKFGQLPETLTFKSPSGGGGALFQHLDGATTMRLWKGDLDHQELRVQSTGAYTVLPPHHTGYEWTTDHAVATCPKWLRDIYVNKALKDLTTELRPTLREPNEDELKESLNYLDPDDYDRWTAVGMALRSVDETKYFDMWVEWSRRSPKFVEGECERKWATFYGGGGGLTPRSIFHWAMQNGYKPPDKHEPLTDGGDANMLARMAEGRIRHSSHWGWLGWTGQKWAIGNDGVKVVQEIQKIVIETRRTAAKNSLKKYVRNTPKEDPDFLSTIKKKGSLIKAIDARDSGTRYRESRGLASSRPDLSVDYRDYNQKPYLLNCVNGTFNLRTGELGEHCEEDLLTQVCPTPIDLDAKCPLWVKFLEDILPDESIRRFLQVFFGHCLTGDASGQIMPVFWGTGANGKSTMVETIFHVLGEDYAMKAKRDLLMSARYAGHPTSIARLHGKRFVACVETDEFGRFDEPMLKELTGDDKIAARRMREDEWEFQPTHKLVLATNHKPEVRGTDDGIWRRIPLVPFLEKFLEGDPRRDPTLKEKLKAEAAGILTWMVEGTRLWIEAGQVLKLPDSVKAATQEYRCEQDKIALFLMECCDIGEDKQVRIDKLVDRYTAWCATNKHTQLNGTRFGRALNEKGFKVDATRKHRSGLTLKTS